MDYRTGVYGWDLSQVVPKVGDLVVITSERSEYKDRVMRLIDDNPSRQTVTVGEDLTSDYGHRILFNRKGDIRALTSSDKVLVDNKP